MLVPRRQPGTNAARGHKCFLAQTYNSAQAESKQKNTPRGTCGVALGSMGVLRLKPKNKVQKSLAG